MAISDFPEEILIDIFSRLPAKSVGKCRCLAKPWRTLLSTPQFIKSHLSLIRKTHRENLILINPSLSMHFIETIKDDAVSRKLELPGDWIYVVGSCDGLVLLVNDEDEKFLVNPITLQQVKVPDSPLALNRGESFSMHGFGYDRFRDDYKIVTLSYCDTDNEYEPDYRLGTFVDVYSVKMGIWKMVDSFPYEFVYELPSGAFLNGAIHWLASKPSIIESDYLPVIAAFNLVDEVFTEIPAPSDVNLEKFALNKLVVLGGCLCLIDARSNFGTVVWIMGEYGLAESWTRFSIDADYECDILKPLCYIGDEEVVLVGEGETLVVYNLGEGTLRDMVVDGIPAMFIDGCTFAGSLVSPVFNLT